MATKKKAVKKSKPIEDWTEKKILVWLRSAMRSASRRYPPLYAALAAAKEPYNVPSTDKSYNARQKYSYRCAECNNLFSGKEVAIDHRIDCGSLLSWDDLPGFASRLFCQQEDLDILCHPCHDVKTLMAKSGLNKEEATLQKAVNTLIKEKTAKQLLDYLSLNNYSGVSVSNAEKRKKAVYTILKEKNDGKV